jgi:hypothetical protein
MNRDRRKRDTFVRAVEDELLVIVQRACQRPIEGVKMRSDPTLLADIIHLVHDELAEMGHRERLAYVYRFLDRLPVLWAADSTDVAKAIVHDRLDYWAEYAAGDPRMKGNNDHPNT